MTEPLRNHGDHGGATAVYAVQAPQWQRTSGATGVFGPYCCALRDYDETFTGDANRGNFLAMLKLTAQMQHTFQHEANIRPTSLTSLVEESLLRKVNACMGPNSWQSRLIRIIMRGFFSLPTGQKPPLCASALKQCGQYFFMHTRSLHSVWEELQCHETTATMSDDRLT